MSVEAVSSHVFVRTDLRSCNVGMVVTDGGIVLIDSPMFPSDALAWAGEVEARGAARYLLHTEYHNDHVRGDFWMPVSIIIAQEGVRREAIAAQATVGHYIAGMQQEDAEGTALARYEQRIPEITFDDQLTLYLGRHTFDLRHIPGHTYAQTAITVPEEGICFTGDNLVCNTHPHMIHALPQEWLHALDRLRHLGVDRYVPGHGPVCGPEALDTLQTYLREMLDQVRRAIQSGWTREETMGRMTSLRDFFPLSPDKDEDLFSKTYQAGVGRFYDILRAESGRS